VRTGELVGRPVDRDVELVDVGPDGVRTELPAVIPAMVEVERQVEAVGFGRVGVYERYRVEGNRPTGGVTSLGGPEGWYCSSGVRPLLRTVICGPPETI